MKGPIILLYFCLINIISFFLMYSDKKRARKGKWRIQERTLFAFAIFGGAIGILLGGKWFRHKTRHKSFKYGIPLIIVLQLAALFYTLTNFYPEMFNL